MSSIKNITVQAPKNMEILQASPLSQDLFTEFGTVIQNPIPLTKTPDKHVRFPAGGIIVNQGNAVKYSDVTHMDNLYSSAPSGIPSKAVMNMFVCTPRNLRSPNPRTANDLDEGQFIVSILERHPFTTQTFVPLGLSSKDQNDTYYLVIVAPTLPAFSSSSNIHLPTPTQSLKSRSLPGKGLPDLSRVKAFIAKGSQAVTYGAGTWHAPMVVVGKRAIDFVVVQFANGIGIEDCQEIEINAREGNEIAIAIPKLSTVKNRNLSRL